ncbi:SPOR domain-containing protein [Advenella alkanexedens]|uniref:SPOR domain-containing protein n=1 Tax=Advenella alkanexedens TaxID=1481665 RepID=UPI002675A69F|nr:SPOR domain-containing protein [Advenella alkanexedens]WKU19584.1 SPOR domain-containing protein [Advenella alkanexedens]
MAKRRTTRSSSSRSRSSSNSSSSFSSILTGLIIGLTIAAIAAFMLTRTPVPLKDNSGNTSSSGIKMPGTSSTVGSMSPGNQPLIDPNAWLSNDGRITSQQSTPSGTGKLPPLRPLTSADPVKTPPSGVSQDQIGSLINQLPAANTTTPAKAGADTKTATPVSPAAEQKLALAAKDKDIPLDTTKPASNGKTPEAAGSRYLQVGAFRNAKEADSIRARMILMGYNAEITKITVNNVEINRVRIGPFKNDDELNRSRTELSKAKISSTIVR